MNSLFKAHSRFEVGNSVNSCTKVISNLLNAKCNARACGCTCWSKIRKWTKSQWNWLWIQKAYILRIKIRNKILSSSCWPCCSLPIWFIIWLGWSMNRCWMILGRFFQWVKGVSSQGSDWYLFTAFASYGYKGFWTGKKKQRGQADDGYGVSGRISERIECIYIHI